MDPPTMKWWGVVAIVVTAVKIADAAEPGHPLTIDLQMRSDARVPAHVLGKAHSPTGVMQAGWDKALVKDAARGSLTFTEAQAARIRMSR
jgi:hypothetical protein